MNTMAIINLKIIQRKNKNKQKNNPTEKNSRKLTQLKKLLRATKLATPKIYSAMKNKTNQQQIEILYDIFHKKDIPCNSEYLTNSVIAQTKKEYDIKHELKDLGIDENTNDTSERSRRTKTRVNYKMVFPKFDENDNEHENEDEGENENEDENENENENGDENENDTSENENNNVQQKKNETEKNKFHNLRKKTMVMSVMMMMMITIKYIILIMVQIMMKKTMIL